MGGVLEDRELGVGDAAVVAECGGGGDYPVVGAPDDHRRDFDLFEAVAGVVFDDGVEGVGEAGAGYARGHLLPEQLLAQAAGIADCEAEHQPAGAAVDDEEAGGGGEGAAERVPSMRCGAATLVREPGVDETGGGDEDEAVEAARFAQHRLGGNQAAHRVADQGHVLAEAELLAEIVQQATVGGHVDGPGGHRAGAETRQFESDRAVAAPEVRQVFEPVLPGARDSVDEDDRLALADLGVVDRRPRQLEPVKVWPPVELQPVRIWVAVVVTHNPYVRVWVFRGSVAAADGPRGFRAGARTGARPRLRPAAWRSRRPAGRERESSGRGAGHESDAPWSPPWCGYRSCRRRSAPRTRGQSSRRPCRPGRR